MVHIIFTLVFLLTFIYRNSIHQRLIFTLGTFILFVFLALRYQYGNDYDNYHKLYELYNYFYKNDIPIQSSEKLYAISNIIMPNFLVFIAFHSYFYMKIVKKLIMNHVPMNKWWLSLFLLLFNPYLFLVHLSSLRQTTAILLFIMAIEYVDKKLLNYYLLVIVAIFFHKSAVVLLAVPLIFYFKNMHRKNKKKFLFLFVVIFFNFDIIVNYALHVFPNHYGYYLRIDEGNSILATIISLIYVLFFFRYYYLLKTEERKYGLMSILASLLSVLSYKLSMLTRLEMYFSIFNIVTVPVIMSRINIKTKKVFWSVFIFLITVSKYISFFNNPIWTPFKKYKSILDIIL